MEVMFAALSLRKDSANLKLLNLAMHSVKASASSVNLVDLNAYPLPYYNQEIEESTGVPQSALLLKEKFDSANALILASPEYNFSMPGHFKNTLDWLSRCKPQQPFKNKPILLLSASPAMAGGNRGLWELRQPLEALGAFVFPNMFSLSLSHEAFTAEHKLKNEQLAASLEAMVQSFLKFSGTLSY